jgi:hypothetical protein
MIDALQNTGRMRDQAIADGAAQVVGVQPLE